MAVHQFPGTYKPPPVPAPADLPTPVLDPTVITDVIADHRLDDHLISAGGWVCGCGDTDFPLNGGGYTGDWTFVVREHAAHVTDMILAALKGGE